MAWRQSSVGGNENSRPAGAVLAGADCVESFDGRNARIIGGGCPHGSVAEIQGIVASVTNLVARRRLRLSFLLVGYRESVRSWVSQLCASPTNWSVHPTTTMVKSNMWEFLGRWWISAAIIMVAAAFLDAAMRGEVIFHDGLAALSVASVALVEVIKERPRKPLRILGAAGAVIVAYLWFANGADTSPINVQVAVALALLFLLALFAGFAPTVPFSQQRHVLNGALMLAIIVALLALIWALFEFLLP